MLPEIVENRKWRTQLAIQWADELGVENYGKLRKFIDKMQIAYTMTELQTGKWIGGQFIPGDLPIKDSIYP